MKRMLTILWLLTLGVIVYAQHAGIKTNLLYGIYTQTPNLGVEIALSPKSTLNIEGGYNPWNLKGSEDNNKKKVHWLTELDYRYWLCQKFNGSFVGMHLLGSEYNISGYNMPFLFGKGAADFRFQGWAAGVGIHYGYQFILSQHWNIELSLGLGYAYLKYNKYECRKCGEKLGQEQKNYLGPTKASVSLIYLINK